jgi:hypothetical protein
VTLFENDAYRLTLTGAGRRIDVGSLLALSLLAALDTTDGADETLAVLAPEVRGETILVERRSTLWERAWLELRCLESSFEVHTCVSGRGALTGVRLLGGRSVIPGAHLGRIHSGTRLQTLFSPNPEDGVPPLRPAAEGAAIGVVGGGEPCRARWASRRPSPSSAFPKSPSTRPRTASRSRSTTRGTRTSRASSARPH